MKTTTDISHIPEHLQEKINSLNNKDLIIENIIESLNFILDNSPENNILKDDGLIDLLRITHNETQNIQVFLEKQYFLEFLNIFGKIDGFSNFFINFIIKEKTLFDNFSFILDKMDSEKIKEFSDFNLNQLLEKIKKED